MTTPKSKFSWLLALLLCAPAAGAQTQTTGAIQGRVYEIGTNQPLVGAAVTLIHRGTGASRQMRTDANGTYVIQLVPPGEYTIAASFLGYETDPAAGVNEIPVRLARTEVIVPPPIGLRKIGSLDGLPRTLPTMQPASDAPESQSVQLVNTLNATRGESFSRWRLLSLPLAGGRSFDNLALLVPGVAPPPQAVGNTVGPGVGAGVGTAGQFAVNGLRSRGNNFTVDGSDNNDEDIGVRRQGFTALLPQSTESLQEYQIMTLLPEPLFGRNFGAQVNAVSRSGETKLHGTVYGFFTDQRLKARDPFDLTGGPANFALTRAVDGAAVLLNDKPLAAANPVGDQDPFTRAQYGFVLGGPLVKRQAHFFVTFERTDLNARKEVNFAVPTMAERGLFGLGERGFVLVTGSEPPRGIFPASATGDAFFSLYPFPNNPRGPYGANTFTDVLRAGADGTIFSVKLDQNLRALGRDHTFTSRYNFTDDDTTLPVTGEALFSSLRPQVRAQNLSLSFTSGLAAHAANQLRVSYGRTRLRFQEVRHPFLRASNRLPNAPFLLNAPLLTNATRPAFVDGRVTLGTPRYLSQAGINTETITGPLGQVQISGFSPVGVDVFNFPQRRVNNTFQVADTLFDSLGQHRLTAGADIRRTQLNSALDRNFRSVAAFSGAPDIASTFGLNRFSPDGFYRGADFVAAGVPTGFFQTLALVPDATIGLRYWQQNFFVSDQFRLRKNFTFTLGLRYELNTVPREVNERIEATFTSSAVRNFIATERQLTNGVSGFEQYLAGRSGIFSGDHNNLAPHFALAWDPLGHGKLALRAGYGIYYDQIPGAVISQSRSVFPSFLTLNLSGIGDANSSEFRAFNPAQLAQANTLNTYDPTRFGSDPVAFLLGLARLSIPVPPRPGNAPPVQQNFFGGPGFVLPAADLPTPYAQHWALTIEQEIKRDWLVSAAYVGTKGTNLLRFATPNLGPNTIPFVTRISPRGFEPVIQGGVVAPGQNLDFRRPYPFLGSFTAIAADANSNYHSLQALLNKRFTHSLQFTAAYTWSHAIDEVSDLFDLAGARGLPQNSFHRRAERGNANFDVRQRAVVSFIWNVPFFASHKLVGGWQLTGIGTVQTGQPYTMLSGYDINLDGNLTDRLQSVAGITEVQQGAVQWQFPANPLTLLARPGQDGAVGRNTFRAPGIRALDLALLKRFKFRERQEWEVRGEFFNVFNRPHFGIPVHQLGAPGLGSAVETRLPMRTVQLALRYSF